MSLHLSKLEATLRLDTSYLTLPEEEQAWNDVEYLAAECRVKSRHDIIAMPAYEMQRLLRLCVSNYIILDKVVKRVAE